VNRSTRYSAKAASRRRLGLTAALTVMSLAIPTAAFAVTPGAGPAGKGGVRAAMPPYGMAVPRSLSPLASVRAGDGDPDPSIFGLDGKVGVHGSATSDDMLVGSSIAPDGKILASGYREESNGEFSTVTRRNTDGSPDLSFGNKGVASVHGLNGPALKVVATADGGMVGVGYTLAGDSPDVAVFRLDASGQVVQSFGQNGVVQFHNPGPDLGTDILVQPDGKIVLIGFTAPTESTSDIFVRRLLPNGASDTGFGVGGEAVVNVSDSDQASAVALQPDGKIVVVGGTDLNNEGLVLRFNQDGTADQSFGTRGVVTLNPKGFTEAYDVAVQSDGKIDVAGYTASPEPGVPGDAVVFRLQANGLADASFNGNGRVIFANDGDDIGYTLGIEPDNSIVVSAFQPQENGEVTDSFLNRVTSNGALDPTFGTRGAVRVHNTEATFELGLSIQSDGKIVVAGRRGGFNIVNSIGTIDRFNLNGTFDTTH